MSNKQTSDNTFKFNTLDIENNEPLGEGPTIMFKLANGSISVRIDDDGYLLINANSKFYSRLYIQPTSGNEIRLNLGVMK